LAKSGIYPQAYNFRERFKIQNLKWTETKVITIQNNILKEMCNNGYVFLEFLKNKIKLK